MTAGLNEAKALLRQFRSLLAFAQVIDEIGNVDEELRGKRLELEQVNQQIAEGLDSVAKIEPQKKAALDGVQDAKAQAKELVTKAKQDAQAIRQAATEKAQQLTDAETAELTKVRQQVQQMRQEVGRLSKAVADAAEEKKAIETEIRRIKALFNG